jgi:Plavaka transposase
MLGVIGASDKTPLTIGSGNEEMHPVLLSLANIDARVHMKATSHSFALAAYLPIPKFVNVSAPVHALLTARVYHICVDIITVNLKLAEAHGAFMSDPSSRVRMCHTPLASWIGDLPEQRVVSCILANQSPFTMATANDFGDHHSFPSRTWDHTLNLIAEACSITDPSLVSAFAKTCQNYSLNGVHQPFWMNWGRANPPDFLTPDALHAFHKFFFDHPLKWVINIMGREELDRRIAALQPCLGVRHWKNGISTLKQCTGREHRDIQKILVSVIANAVPDRVLCAVRALVEFIFHAQGLLLYDEHLHALDEVLREFHTFKNAIINAGGRWGKNSAILHFKIPKLEGLIRVAQNARRMGAPYQYMSDITERCHITHVKTPYRRSSRQNFHEQCCRFMDRMEKLRLFGLYVSLKSNNTSLVNEMFNEASEVANHYPEATWLSHALPPGDISIAGNPSKPSLFSKLRNHLSDDHSTAFLINAAPHCRHVTVNEAADAFGLPDFRGALGDWFVLQQSYAAHWGQRRSTSDCQLPFSYVQVWNNFRIQQCSSQDSRILLPSRTIQALPPSANMPYRRCNTVLVSDTDGSGERTSISGTDSEPQFIFHCL